MEVASCEITCRLTSNAFSGQLAQDAEPTERATVLLAHGMQTSLDDAPSLADAEPAGQGVQDLEFDSELYVPINSSSSSSSTSSI